MENMPGTSLIQWVAVVAVYVVFARAATRVHQANRDLRSATAAAVIGSGAVLTVISAGLRGEPVLRWETPFLVAIWSVMVLWNVLHETRRQNRKQRWVAPYGGPLRRLPRTINAAGQPLED